MGATTLVLAAGTQERFGSPQIKQLLEVGGETLIARMNRQFDNPIVVTNRQDIMRASVNTFQPSKYSVACETLFSTRSAWGRERTTVLLGDVYYSDFIAERIRNCLDDFRIFTNFDEIFAISWTARINLQISEHLLRAIEHSHHGGRGKLWEMYRSYLGKPLARHRPEEFINYYRVSDETTDFDTLEEYNQFIKKHQL